MNDLEQEIGESSWAPAAHYRRPQIFPTRLSFRLSTPKHRTGHLFLTLRLLCLTFPARWYRPNATRWSVREG